MRRMIYSGGLGKMFDVAKVQRSRGGNWSRRAKAFKAVHIQCAKCGALAELECDHIVPKHRGGTDDYSNLQSLCKSCHANKTAQEQGFRNL